jgi:hypothetical protein
MTAERQTEHYLCFNDHIELVNVPSVHPQTPSCFNVPSVHPQAPSCFSPKTQAGMLISPGDSAGIRLVFAAALMESETTQLAPVNAMEIALPAQLK